MSFLTRTKGGVTLALYLLIKCRQHFLLLALLLAHFAYGATEQSPAADQLFVTATHAAYQDMIRNPASGESLTDLGDIIKSAEAAIAANQPALAIATITRNLPAILRQLHLPQTQKIVALALSQHATFIADTLLEHAQSQGDAFGEARISFELATYYANQEKWPAVLALLKPVTVIESLAKDEGAEAQLLIGSALQHQKKHREAMAYYEKIKRDSSSYRLAQLNLATANIRQDWWTDAHLSIQKALKINTTKRDELDYRLYTLLGFSQIQYGFYRDARESFRNVPLKSSYTNHALLGLGMAALHQQDFIGALNAFNHLREKQEYDISVAESYLLIAFTLRQLNQPEAALASYQDAIQYYTQLEKTIAQHVAVASSEVTRPTSLATKLLRPEARKNKQVQALAVKIDVVNSLLKQNVSTTNATALNNAKRNLEQQYTQKSLDLLKAEQESVASYLSQSRFGLATLYDGK